MGDPNTLPNKPDLRKDINKNNSILMSQEQTSYSASYIIALVNLTKHKSPGKCRGPAKPRCVNQSACKLSPVPILKMTAIVLIYILSPAKSWTINHGDVVSVDNYTCNGLSEVCFPTARGRSQSSQRELVTVRDKAASRTCSNQVSMHHKQVI